jgi:hypothetical protein
MYEQAAASREPENRHVAKHLDQDAQLACLLLDGARV